MDNDNLSPEQWHKKEAIENFNNTWDLIDKSHRSHDENLMMVHMAHTSRYHWEKIGEPIHLVRGEWQISRVYSLLNMAESALLHAEESLRLCEENNIGDFDLAFAYEAHARAYGVLKDSIHMEFYRKKASSAADAIKDKGNREYLLSELEKLE